MVESGKDEPATNTAGSVERRTERTKPTLLTLDNGRQVISTGRWNDSVMAGFVLANRDRWIKVGELAKVGCGGNTIPNKRRVRSHVNGLFLELLQRGVFMAVETGSRNETQAVKVADPTSEADRQNVQIKMERMRKRREITAERYERAMEVLSSYESRTVVDEPDLSLPPL
jgi:hypothetical protein